MNQVVIENPIINSPFDEPTRHFRFSDEGITDEIGDGRRTSSYFVPIAKSKKKGSKQLRRLRLSERGDRGNGRRPALAHQGVSQTLPRRGVACPRLEPRVLSLWVQVVLANRSPPTPMYELR